MKSKLYGLLLLLATLAFEVRADNLGYTKDHPLKFAIDLDYPPMEYVDDQGTPSGYDVAFTEKLMERLDIPFVYAPNTWENVADDILKSRVDLGMMVYSPYRKNITNYSKAVFRLYYQMICRKGEENKEGLRSVEGKTYAFMKSQPIIDTLIAGGAKYILIKDLKKALYELSKGQYDGVICYRYQARYLIERHHLDNLVPQDLTLMPREYCYVSHDKQLIEAINQELEKMEKEGVIDDVYGSVRTRFGDFEIPTWIWVLIAFLIFASLGAIIIQQRRSRMRLEKEMKRAQENEQRALKSEELKDIFYAAECHYRFLGPDDGGACRGNERGRTSEPARTDQ